MTSSNFKPVLDLQAIHFNGLSDQRTKKRYFQNCWRRGGGQRGGDQIHPQRKGGAGAASVHSGTKSTESIVNIPKFESQVKQGVRSSKFIWAPVYSCTRWLRHRNSPPPPAPLAFGLMYEGAIGQLRWTTSLCNLWFALFFF